MATIDLAAGCETPAYRPATAFGNGRTLKTRIQMIANNSNPTMPWQVLSAAVLVASAFLLPLGIAFAQDNKAASRLVKDTDQNGQDTSSTSRPRYWNVFWVRGASRIDVAFFNYGQVLEIHGDGKLRGFELAGEDRIFKPATAKITSQITKDPKLESNITWINLASAEVKEPRWIRYAEGTYKTRANLVNVSGQKALPFNTSLAEKFVWVESSESIGRWVNPRGLDIMLEQEKKARSSEKPPETESSTLAKKRKGASRDESADGETTIGGALPYLFWQGSKADSGESLQGEVELPDLKIIKAKLEHLDWSGEAPGKPSLGISLDRHNYLRIELAAEKARKSAMIAILRIPSALNDPNEVNSGKAVFYNYARSRPLKDKGHALELLKSYLNNKNSLESLAEWETADGKLPRGAQL
jgi:hypothetical protein